MARVRDLEKSLAAALKREAEALEQQTATSEILRVISRSQTDVQPVFDTIVRSAVRLCDGLFSALFQFDGELLHRVAQHNFTPDALEASDVVFPARPTRALGAGRAILERAVVHIPDVEVDPEFQHQALTRAIGFRSGLFVPVLREGAPLGVILVARAEAGPFSNNEIELLKTFADQAVIAIENVRLFTELGEKNRALTEALEQQTATSEVLKVISRSAFDLQPVLENVVESATRLCAATRGHIFRFDGEVLNFAAAYGAWPAFTDYLKRHPTPLGRGSVSGRAAVECRTIHVPDVLEDPDYKMGELVRQQGYRAVLAVPMLREGVLLGVIALLKSQPEPFTGKQIELVTTFADQAVIAIENVRLFKELQQKNSALTAAHAQVTEALEQQTATSEILRVISSSPTDGQPVFDVIVESACRLCDAVFANAVQFDGELMHNMAHYGFSPEGRDILMRAFPRAPTRESMSGRAILEGAVVQSEDMSTDEGTALSHQLSRVLGSHAYLSVASNQARLHRITTDSNDWDRLCGLLHSQDGRRSPRHDDVDVETDEFGDERAICSWLGRYPVFEDDILGWDVTVFA